MGGEEAIEFNRQALKRILAAIIAMAGLVFPAPTIQRRLHLAVLRLLRPAESATRRLIIAMARGITVTLAPPGPRKASHKIKVLPIIVKDGAGTGIVLPYGAPVPASLAHLVPPAAAARRHVFPLTDAPRRWDHRRRRPVTTSVPRIGMPDLSQRPFIPVRLPSTPDDAIDAVRLGQRFEVLGRALDDLPAQARRFARWRARWESGRGLHRRRLALRLGRPPGGRLSRYDPDAKRLSNIREVDEILAHAHALAIYALEHPDTS